MKRTSQGQFGDNGAVADEKNDRSRQPVALSIAGSDSCGGAGIQADLRAFWALGCYGATAITCTTAQNLEGVSRIDVLPPEAVSAQIEAVATGFSVAVVKTGMLHSRDIIEAVIDSLQHHLVRVPVVVDPVMTATSGASLLQEDAVLAYGNLFRRARVVTPNLDELAVLVGERPENEEQLEHAARTLFDRFGCAVLAKGGHLSGPPVDILIGPDVIRKWSGKRVEGTNTHGTGCSLASAIAAMLANGLELEEAVSRSKLWLQFALEAPIEIQGAAGPVFLLDGLG